jgi:4-amino-4-deoxy-L-arabinose transferase-like glycosyltransferase
MRKALTGPWAWLWLFLAIVVLRAPGLVFGILDIDESDAVIIGRLMGEGALPYVDFVEKKPLLFYLFCTPAALFGFHIWPMQILAIGWCFATALVVGRTARRWSGSAETGAVAAWLCVAASAANVLSVNAELMLNLPAALALYFFVRAEERASRWADGAAGFFIGIASLFKHQGAILLPVLAIALLWQWVRLGRGPQIGRFLALGGGFALPWGLAVAFYAALGHAGAFYEWNVERNLFYSAYGAGSAWARFGMGLLLYVLAAAPVLWWLAIRGGLLAKDRDPVRVALALALVLTWVPVSLGGRFYAHYYLQFVPALALLAAPHVAARIARWGELRAASRRLFAAGLWLPVLFYSGYAVTRGVVGRYPAQEPKTVVLAGWLRENTPEQARLFVWGHYTPIYYLAERLPGTRYYNTSLHMGDFDPAHLAPGTDLRPFRSERDIRATLEDLERLRPEIVVDTAPANIHDWAKVPLQAFPEIDGYVQAHYERVAVAAGAPVYRRREPAAVVSGVR